MQKIIIIGKPNVGKSSLFNCLLKEKIAITSDIEGTTRDINIKTIKINDISATLCDTAGIIENKSLEALTKNKNTNKIFIDIKKRILSFVKDEDIVIYVIDGKEAIDNYDVKLFRNFKKSILVVNKIDLKKDRLDDWEYVIFGAKNIFYISTVYNHGIRGLRDFIGFILLNKKSNDENLIQNLESSSIDSTTNCINIGIIGRVNVGKSSILNAILNKERSVVSEIEGTTIDPVCDKIIHKDKTLNFVDTAGIRQKSKIEGIEKYALERTRKILELSNIVLLILDASKPFVDLDEKISGLSDKYKLGIIIIINKWDIKYESFEFIKSEIKRKFAYLSYAPIITTSALSKRNIENIKDMILEVWNNFNTRISTSIINETIQEAVKKHPIPSDKGKMIKIYYATQISSAPPMIVLIMNKPKSLHFSYKRYIINYLRKKFNFKGSPILIAPRPKKSLQNLNNLD